MFYRALMLSCLLLPSAMAQATSTRVWERLPPRHAIVAVPLESLHGAGQPQPVAMLAAMLEQLGDVRGSLADAVARRLAELSAEQSSSLLRR
jgi:hypothetical protein